MEFPPITEPELVRRLGLDDAEFFDAIMEMLQAVGAREYRHELYERAIGYPWERPGRSFLLTGETVEVLGDMEPERRQELIDTRAEGPDGQPRYPLLAIGSNGAPGTLIRKFAALDEAESQVLVMAGELHDFDVGAVTQPTVYGSMAATLFPSPGTAVHSAVLWVSALQFTMLSWTEVTYRLGWLTGARFTPDCGPEEITSVLAYASRWGTFCPDGHPIALAAIPATGRTAPAMTQEELLGSGRAPRAGARRHRPRPGPGDLRGRARGGRWSTARRSAPAPSPSARRCGRRSRASCSRADRCYVRRCRPGRIWAVEPSSSARSRTRRASPPSTSPGRLGSSA